MTSHASEVLLDVGDARLPALVAPPPDPPRGTILALHGGGMNRHYFDGDAAPELSLLRVGLANGWAVVALDRPGYGASEGLPVEAGSLTSQADMVFRAIDTLARTQDLG